MAVWGIFRRPGLRSLALCAMVAAAALAHASPSLAQGAETAGVAGAGIAGPSVVVDLSAIDEAVALRRLVAPADAPSPLPPAVSPPGAPAQAPVPGTPAFSALFPPPPPVAAEPAQPRRRTAQASVERISPAIAVAALPVARPVARPGAPGRIRFAAPTPRRPVIQAAAARAVSPVRYAGRLPAVAPAPAAPAAKPVLRRETAEPDRRVRLRLPYPVAGTHLSPSAQAQLEALVAEVGADDHVRLRLAAYANAGAGSAAKARRTSIARVLAVRGFLIERGIKAGRIDLRALGHMAGTAEADRVDVVVADK